MRAVCRYTTLSFSIFLPTLQSPHGSTQFDEVIPQAYFRLGQKLVSKSTDFPTTSTAGFTTSTKRGPTFTASHHHRFLVHPHHHDAHAGGCSAALSNGWRPFPYSLLQLEEILGNYSLVAESPEWQSHPTNIITTTSAAGIITISHRARPVIIKPTLYLETEKKQAVINLFNYKELQWKEWTSASMELHQAMVNSIRALNLATIERLSGHAGIISLSCRQLLAHITTIFGTLHASDVFFIENHIKEELTSFAAFCDFINQSQLAQLLRHSR
jgi:hypothetical protein